MPQARVRGWLGTGLGLAAGVALLSALCAPAQAAERVALVIGNSAYEHVPELPNPPKDAADVGAALTRLGFAVTSLDDAGYDALRRGLLEFEEAAARSEIAVVFYAGHGIEMGGENYLVPVDARLERDRAVKHEAMGLHQVTASVEGASTLGLVILDACRDNPFAVRRSGMIKRSVKRGLARVEDADLPGTTIVAYAAKEGTTADDGRAGENSPYTKALLKYLEEPGLEVAWLFRKVRNEVLRETNGQEPVRYGELPAEAIYLASGAPPPPPPDPVTSAAGAAAVQGPGSGSPVQPPERRAADIVLPDGLTLADWVLLAENRLKAGDHARLLEEAGAHLREYGRFESVEAIREQAVSGLVAEVRVTTREDAPGALGRIAKLEAAAGARPELLRLKARAHGLLGNHVAQEAAWLQWLRSVPQTHPERRDVLSALARARTAREKTKRFSELLGRPFSHEWKEDSAGWTDLHYAALLGLPEVVAALCDAGMAADVRLKDGSPPFGDGLKRTLVALGYEEFEDWKADGETPLMIAAVGNAPNAAAGLVACGADMEAKNSKGGAKPLHYAARDNAHDVAKLLIESGADMDAKAENGWTPLHSAAWKNAPDVARLLVDRGADVDAKEENGWTPLHVAARDNTPDVAKLLIESGADMDAKTENGWTPLRTAAWKNAPDVAKLLVDRGADVDAKTESGGWTLLHTAAWNNAPDVAKLLIESGADVEAKTENVWTPLLFTTISDSPDVAKLLIERGADVDAKDEDGETLSAYRMPLYNAVSRSAFGVAKLLIKRGAGGTTPLHGAAIDNHLGAAKLLIERGADVNAKGILGETPLHYAASRNALDVAKLLIERGADVNAKTTSGETPLHYTARGNALDVAKLLIERGADVDAKDEDDRTPLSVAALWKNSLDVAKLLIERGADVNAKDEDDRTPLDVAEQVVPMWSQFIAGTDDFGMKELLRRHGGHTGQ